MVGKSTVLKICGLSSAAIMWAIWYDRYRRNKPGYKERLVEKRKAELRKKREANDPYFYLKSIKLCENPSSPQAAQMYMMMEIQKGEELLGKEQIAKGAAHIAMGLGYVPQQNFMLTMQQLAMGLPREVMQLIQDYSRIARSRAQSQLLQSHLGQRSSSSPEKSAPAAPSPAIEQNARITEIGAEEQEPVDVDSIDGDTDPKDKLESEDEEVDAVKELSEDAVESKIVEEVITDALNKTEEEINVSFDSTGQIEEDDVQEVVEEKVEETVPEPVEEEEEKVPEKVLSSFEEVVEEVQKVSEEEIAEEEEEQPNTQELLEDVAKELVTSDENDLDDDEEEQMVDSGHQVQEIFLTAGDDATAGAGEGDLIKNVKEVQVVPESNGHVNGDQEIEEQLD